MKVGIIGAGWISDVMARTLSKTKGIDVVAVASRDINRAQNFAKKFKIPHVYDSYEKLVQDNEVDLVYIGTPHSHHAEHAKLCLQNSKPCLVEKAFTQNALQAEKIIALAKEKNLYLAEAIWTRYMPSRKLINDVINSGIVGKVNTLSCNLCYNMLDKERLIKPELAGGAFLDVGVYGLNFAFMHFGKKIKKIDSSVDLLDTGVDRKENISIYFDDGKIAYIQAGMDCRSDRKGIFWGETGYIIVENINNPNSICTFDYGDKLLKKVKIPRQITGYEYQMLEAKDCLTKGLTESISMPLEESLFVMKIMDNLRKTWGVIYPGESL